VSKFDITTEKLLDRVTSEWRPLEPIVDDLIQTVAPGVAMRRYLARTNRSEDSIRPPLTDQQQHDSGARSIISDRIQSQKKSGRIEVKVEAGVRFVRLVPNGVCVECDRPFPNAAPGRKPRPTSRPAPRPTVVYPTFPQWFPQEKSTAIGGLSE
jgi:hypothetical protein